MTVVPTETVIVAGTKAKPDIFTPVEAGVGLGAGSGVGVDAGAWQDMPNMKDITKSNSPMIKSLAIRDFV